MLKTAELRLHDANEQILSYEKLYDEKMQSVADLSNKVQTVCCTGSSVVEIICSCYMKYFDFTLASMREYQFYFVKFGCHQYFYFIYFQFYHEGT